jgi:hypothetical protein
MGKIIDEDGISLSSVLIVNISDNKNSVSDRDGNFIIEARENDEIRFIKDGYYRTDEKISIKNFNIPLLINLKRLETLIPEVKITYKPTGILEKDSKHFDESKKVASMKSELNDYITSPLKEPLPKNSISKSFTGHDFSTGHVSVNLLTIFGEAVGLIKKASGQINTTPNYFETKNFLTKVRTEIDLSFLTQYGMDDEKIDYFLLYAEKSNQLSKRYRKDFNSMKILFELQSAFQQYNKTHK